MARPCEASVCRLLAFFDRFVAIDDIPYRNALERFVFDLLINPIGYFIIVKFDFCFAAIVHDRNGNDFADDDISVVVEQDASNLAEPFYVDGVLFVVEYFCAEPSLVWFL